MQSSRPSPQPGPNPAGPSSAVKLAGGGPRDSWSATNTEHLVDQEVNAANEKAGLVGLTQT